MPQINRVRVNNVKYNFGTQFYDDFMMRFNCRNTIYDLANGGGKSLLMLLLMQNMIPNCTLDEKQPIEKLFRKGSDNTCIHSLVEWKLDAHFQRDGYRYMTTGFCARKAGSTDDGEITASGNASIEYFNYCIFYRQFGPNDIKNLPLVNDGERVTYNGLKAYLREAVREDKGIEVHIFDRKGDYQSFISHYGIYESAWEIVRGINKTEGHVRTYFETNYRTSRKVVEELLIEEIIQKSYNNRLAVDNDDSMMAKTLLDIKDKLIELSQKNSQINNYDNQRAALTQFREYVISYKDFYVGKLKTEETLYDMLAAATSMAGAKQEELEAYEKNNSQKVQELENKKKNIAVAKVLSEKMSQSDIQSLVKKSTQQLAQKEEHIDTVKKRLRLMESANDYCDYIEYGKELLKVNTALNNRMREDEDITAELAKLAREYGVYYLKHSGEWEEQAQEAAKSEKLAYDMLEAAKDNHKSAEKDCAVLLSLRDNLQEKIAEKEAGQQELCRQYGILVADTAQTELEECDGHIADMKGDIVNIKNELDKETEHLYKSQEQESLLKARRSMLEDELLSYEKQKQHLEAEEKKLSDIERVYGVKYQDGLGKVILAAYTKLEAEYNDRSKEHRKLEKYISAVKSGDYDFDNPDRDIFRKYLNSLYGEDVVEGHEWCLQLDEAERKEVLKQIPFVEYAFIIKNDFSRVKNNEALTSIGRGSCIYPVISEQAINDRQGIVNKDGLVFAFKAMDFIRDAQKREAELRAASEELDNISTDMHRLESRKQTIWEDYIFVVRYETILDNAQKAPADEVRQELDNLAEEYTKAHTATQEYGSKKEAAADMLKEYEGKLEELNKRATELKKVADAYLELTEYRGQLTVYNDRISEAERRVLECAAQLDGQREEYIKADERKAAADKKYAELVNNWENNFLEFYEAEPEELAQTEPAQTGEYSDEDIRELIGRFTGLKDILMNKNADMSDKETLKTHLELSMKKCADSIEYRGNSLDKLKQLYEAGNIAVSSADKLRQLSDELSKLQRAYSEADRELGMQEAMLNRLEGSITYAVSQIEERYGAYEEFECDNPQAYIKSNTLIVQELEKNIRKEAESKKKLEKELKDIDVCRKDIERIMSNAGLDIPDELILKKSDMKHYDYSSLADEYEQTAKEYSAILKLEYKKADEFVKYKMKLMDALKLNNGEELANQIGMSVNMPKDTKQTNRLVESLDETGSFIELEKTRIHKGIEDMERIKDNFENRCIQTCSNIRTELERLPKLSHIRMDNEDISIISLMIPYVKEAEYKERMSEYIDETIEAAESFSNQEERFRYIRNRLTWKRLFSVIVTDMNAIRINLYKRERIKDQSRYLRYEEAVGSTGQSQGIYIQFLIAIINYISNINTVSDGGIIGNTIFIDNPFGAAKDIYIWEPIFRLLSVNHVQLIVPARGATPAITARFDVNYILGQQMSENRQQTVVVDYYSNVKEQELEYTRMDYEQARFDFI